MSKIEKVQSKTVIEEYENGYKTTPVVCDLTLLPWGVLEELAQVMTDNCIDYGGKYDRDNWKRGTSQKMLAGALQHLVCILKGSDDYEHSTHFATRVLMYLYLLKEERTKHQNTVDKNN